VVILMVGAALLFFNIRGQLREAKEAQANAEKKLKALRSELSSLKDELSSFGEEATRETATEETTSAEGESGVEGAYTPPRGSAERTAILDAVRDYLGWDYLFIVHNLKVKDDYAYGTLEQHNPAEPESHYESFVTLLRKSSGTWECLECLGGADLLDIEETSGMDIEDWLQDRYPDAPSEIFE
jgi:hypothetical protein